MGSGELTCSRPWDGQNAGMDEHDDCADPALARASGAGEPEDRDEMMRKWWRKFWLMVVLGMPVGFWLCYLTLRPTP
jgi:hypothetical protein